MRKIFNIFYFGLLLTGCQKPVEPPLPPRPALVIVAGKATENNAMLLVGEVKSRYETNLSFRISGKIIERKMDVGSFVKKGQVIARLDATDTHLNASAALAEVRVAEANLALAQSEVARQRLLVDKKFISQSSLDKFEAQFKSADARVRQAKALAANLNNQSQYSALVADRDGVLTQIHAEPGQVVEAGVMIAQIVDNKQIEVLVAVPESRIADLKIGNTVTIKLWADREKVYQGVVREIAPAAHSATRAFDVRITMIDADSAVKLGMTAGVHFSKDAQSLITVPLAALTQISGKKTVWVINQDGIANPREVQAGQFTEQGVVINSGLSSGEMVAIAGVHTLIKGQKVIPVIESAP